jgi:hypothetical protein
MQGNSPPFLGLFAAKQFSRSIVSNISTETFISHQFWKALEINLWQCSQIIALAASTDVKAIDFDFYAN